MQTHCLQLVVTLAGLKSKTLEPLIFTVLGIIEPDFSDHSTPMIHV